MVRTLALRSAVGALAGLVAVTGLTVPAQAQTGPPVPLAEAGTLVGWGFPPTTPGAVPAEAYTLPESLQGTAFSKVVANETFSVALTAAGKVVVLNESGLPDVNIAQIPGSLATATVTDIVTNGNWAGAITSDGRVTVWGQALNDLPEPTDVPANLTDVAKLAITNGGSAAAIKTNGDVVMWGRTNNNVEDNKPANLGTGVKAVVGGNNHYYALKGDGNLAAWGNNGVSQTELPETVTSGGNVTEIETGFNTGLALLDDGSLAYWGDKTFSQDGPIFPAPVPLPESLAGKHVVEIAAGTQYNFLALDDEGDVTLWSDTDSIVAQMSLVVPSEMPDVDVAGFTWGSTYIVALVTEVLEVNKSTISGAPTVGQALTGTPATFSADPDATATQWLADGVEIAGATGPTLTLAPAHLGRRITFATTATKTGEDPFVSISAELGPVQNPPTPNPPQPPVTPPVTVKPTFKVNKAPTSKKKGKATVTVPTRSPKGKATGKATVTIKKGKTTKRIKVTLSGGKRSISLPKLKKGTWKVQISYNGDKNYKAQKSKAYKLKVKK